MKLRVAMRSLPSVFLAAMITASAQAQVAQITTVPANPVAGVPFLIRVLVQPCFGTGNAIVSSGNIDIHLTEILMQVCECWVQFELQLATLLVWTVTSRIVDSYID